MAASPPKQTARTKCRSSPTDPRHFAEVVDAIAEPHLPSGGAMTV
ncbi:hypothetical protein ACIGZJ_22180 [Kitasatospora sp. NPDC052868]